MAVGNVILTETQLTFCHHTYDTSHLVDAYSSCLSCALAELSPGYVTSHNSVLQVGRSLLMRRPVFLSASKKTYQKQKLPHTGHVLHNSL